MKYFGYFADGERIANANCSLAAVNKMLYIADSISRVNGETEIISAVTPKCGRQKTENKKSVSM